MKIVGEIDGVPIKRYPMGMIGPKPNWSPKIEKKSKHARAEAERMFWNQWSKANTNQEKLALLITASRRRFKLPCNMAERNARMRQLFQETKVHFALNGRKCAVCKELATARHHIFQLQNGGRNHRKNLMALCDTCHTEIHPWTIKEKENLVDAEAIARAERD